MSDEAPSTKPKPFVFVLMPFDSRFDDIYKFGIQGAASDVGAYAERVDEQLFTEGMLDRIFTQISKADVIVADMTGRNPNVFYEVGYAHALDKIVLLLTQDSNDIPFDLKHRQHTVYGGKIDLLRTELARRMQWAIAESQRRTARVAAEFISVHVFNQAIPAGIQPDEPPVVSATVRSSQNIFTLPVQVRNDSAETLEGITHVYLFTEGDPAILPAKREEAFSFPFTSTSVSPPTVVKTLESYKANPMDTPDGLVRQYRLPMTFPAMPPGAVEVSPLSLAFAKGQTACDAIYRLRLHTQTKFYDYTFRLKMSTLPS